MLLFANDPQASAGEYYQVKCNRYALNKGGYEGQNPYAKSSRSIERFYNSLFGCSVLMLMASSFAIVHVVIIHLISS